MGLLAAIRGKSKGRALLRYVSNAWIAYIPSSAVRHAWYGSLFDLADGANVMMGLTIRQPGGIRVGRNSNVNPGCLIDSRGGDVVIGDYCDISPEVNIWTLQHDFRDADFAPAGGPVTLGDYVWIGNRAIVLPGVTLGEGCVVAAGAVVTRSVPPYTVVGGVPAKSIAVRPRPQHPRPPYKPFLL